MPLLVPNRVLFLLPLFVAAYSRFCSCACNAQRRTALKLDVCCALAEGVYRRLLRAPRWRGESLQCALLLNLAIIGNAACSLPDLTSCLITAGASVPSALPAAKRMSTQRRRLKVLLCTTMRTLDSRLRTRSSVHPRAAENENNCDDDDKTPPPCKIKPGMCGTDGKCLYEDFACPSEAPFCKKPNTGKCQTDSATNECKVRALIRCFVRIV